jgi:hypothetical protein
MSEAITVKKSPSFGLEESKEGAIKKKVKIREEPSPARREE